MLRHRRHLRVLKLRITRYPRLSAAPLFRQIEESGADLVVTDCEACKWQIEMSTSKRCEHPLTVLAQALV
ncbi:anaerobic glycerol-3-phosphate dehydrogenase subunit C [Klebsiella pneumoniae subsp. rhinoscleromatis]|nr:anaerobic glycerol-3-phosphate dehydrogenase subunit C [Klebsiella pneumoniae subsp. rhinoscleromatis]